MNQNKIIADYIRYTMNSNDNDITKSDQELIDLYGGSKSNKIVCDFENGFYLYESVDDSHGELKIYIVIDTNNLANSFSGEYINPDQNNCTNCGQEKENYEAILCDNCFDQHCFDQQGVDFLI